MPSTSSDEAVLVNAFKTLHETVSPAVWRAQARAFLEHGDVDRCKQVLVTLLSRNPDDVDGQLQLAKVLVEHLGPPSCKGAVAACRRACDLVEGQDNFLRAHALCALGVSLSSCARACSLPLKERALLRNHALDALQSATEQCPQNSPVAPYISYNMAVLYAELGQASEAMAQAREALSGSHALHSTTEHRKLEVHCVLLLALLLTGQQQPQAALSTLSVLQQPSPMRGEPATHTLYTEMALPRKVLFARMLASIHLVLGDKNSAIKALAQCKHDVEAAGTDAKHGKHMAEVWQELAAVFAQAGLAADACFCADQALQLEPWTAASHVAAGQAHEACGLTTSAMDSYSTALSLDCHYPPALLKMGRLMAKSSTLTQLSAACDMLTDGLRLEPTNVAGWYQLGLACRAMKHHARAEQHLRTALQLAATAPVIPYTDVPLCFPPAATHGTSSDAGAAGVDGIEVCV